MLRRKRLTINFESAALRLVSFRSDEVEKWTEISLPESMIQGGLVKEPEAVAERLVEALESNDMPTNRVTAAISGHRAIFRSITFPPIEEELLDSAIRRKIRQDIPLPEGEMDLSWSVLEATDDQVQTFIVAVPRTIIDSHMRALQIAGLKPKALDVGPLSLLLTANLEDAVIANLEQSNLSVIILQEKVPTIVRTVPIGAQAASPEGRLELLAQELGRTTKFYNESHKDKPLPESTPVLATGAYFNESSMLERFQQLSPYPVRFPNPPLRFGSDFPMPQYAINLGLALKEL